MPKTALDGTIILSAPVLIGEEENADLFRFAADRKLTLGAVFPAEDYTGYDMVTASIGTDGGYRMVLPADAEGGAKKAILVLLRQEEQELAVFSQQESMWKIVPANLILPASSDPQFSEVLKTAAEAYGLPLESGQVMTLEVIELLKYLAE